ncbi:hypothetical protein FB45DRAFT_1023189 [Roridomyces roridus]|uniref:Translation initiation factor 3 N-terminal domain-containing protein n=1 Tax=Roridomyces roridus TaxID=1738132 RepID=A0AAD7C3S3_9AGAR|nr:hypothetical protein FB45DRAFT_1023189 [Roridomyces roridus]
MNTFAAFRFAARTILRPHRPNLPCLVFQTRFKSNRPTVKTNNRLRNKDIPFQEVHLADENGVLVKTSLRDLLERIDHRNQWVELVAQEPPVVKIIDKKARLALQKQAKEKAREVARKNMVKEVQLTWMSEAGDLQHKLTRARAYLEMGARVDIVFSPKPKVTNPPPHVQREKIGEIVETLADVSTEFKPVEWRRGMAIVSLKGTAAETIEGNQVDEQGTAAEAVAKAAEAEAVEAEAVEAEVDQPPVAEPAASKPKNFKDLSEFGNEGGQKIWD